MWKPCTSCGTHSVKKRWRNMRRTSAWQLLPSTSGESAMSKAKPSPTAGPRTVSPKSTSSCEGGGGGSLYQWREQEGGLSDLRSLSSPCRSGAWLVGDSATTKPCSPAEGEKHTQLCPSSRENATGCWETYPQQQSESLASMGTLPQALLQFVCGCSQELI